MKKTRALKELVEFLMKRKKWWLVPIITLMALLGALMILSEGSALSPFIYALF